MLFDLLKIDESSLTTAQLCLLKELISEYLDIFALDPTELRCTDLITHSIDTEDSVETGSSHPGHIFSGSNLVYKLSGSDPDWIT